MTSHKQVVYQSQLDHKSKLLLRRRTRKRFNPRIFIDRIIETTAILSLLFTGFAGVGAMGCWGMEIATSSQYWQHQKKTCLGMMLVSFSGFLGSALIGAGFSIQRTIKLTTSEIRTILQGCQYTLRLVGSSKDYRRLQSSEYFSTSNNVVLNDAFNVLGEIVNAIDDVEQATQQ